MSDLLDNIAGVYDYIIIGDQLMPREVYDSQMEAWARDLYTDPDVKCHE